MHAAPSATCKTSSTDARPVIPPSPAMSLINEALKKAQKLRTGDPAGTAASVPGSGMHVTKRGEPRSAQQLMLMAAGGVVLVVLSVVATFWFVNRAPASKPAPKPVIVKSADTSAPIPAIIPPVVATETLPAKSAPPPVAVEKPVTIATRSEEHTSELQPRQYLVCRLLL